MDRIAHAVAVEHREQILQCFISRYVDELPLPVAHALNVANRRNHFIAQPNGGLVDPLAAVRLPASYDDSEFYVRCPHRVPHTVEGHADAIAQQERDECHGPRIDDPLTDRNPDAILLTLCIPVCVRVGNGDAEPHAVPQHHERLEQ